MGTVMWRTLTLTAALLLATPTAAHAAEPSPDTVWTVVAPDIPAEAVDAAAADWSKNTGLDVQVGDSCAGATCIHASFVDFACGREWAGCAYPAGEGCTVELASWATQYGLPTITAELTHEIGHCVWGPTLGYAYHLDSDRAVMDATMDPWAPPTRLTAQERRITRDL